jgi:hypothetical protein
VDATLRALRRNPALRQQAAEWKAEAVGAVAAETAAEGQAIEAAPANKKRKVGAPAAAAKEMQADDRDADSMFAAATTAACSDSVSAAAAAAAASPQSVHLSMAARERLRGSLGFDGFICYRHTPTGVSQAWGTLAAEFLRHLALKHFGLKLFLDKRHLHGAKWNTEIEAVIKDVKVSTPLQRSCVRLL